MQKICFELSKLVAWNGITRVCACAGLGTARTQHGFSISQTKCAYHPESTETNTAGVKPQISSLLERVENGGE